MTALAQRLFAQGFACFAWTVFSQVSHEYPEENQCPLLITNHTIAISVSVKIILFLGVGGCPMGCIKSILKESEGTAIHYKWKIWHSWPEVCARCHLEGNVACDYNWRKRYRLNALWVSSDDAFGLDKRQSMSADRECDGIRCSLLRFRRCRWCDDQKVEPSKTQSDRRGSH